jgi:hypothetical protein
MMKSSVWFACYLLGIASTLFGRDLTGTVYSDHSGPSGASTGEVELSTSTGLISIHYRKPFPRDFSSDTCLHLGAVWTVRMKQNSLEEIAEARCKGQVDLPVHSAWMATLDYVKEVAQRAGYEIGFRLDRPRRPNQIVNMYGLDVEVSGYLDFPQNGMCFEVKERVSKTSVIIQSSADCFFYPAVEFTNKQTGPNTWAVTSVKALHMDQGR